MKQDEAQTVRQISGLSEISDRYDAILCDIWGVAAQRRGRFSARLGGARFVPAPGRRGHSDQQRSAALSADSKAGAEIWRSARGVRRRGRPRAT